MAADAAEPATLTPADTTAPVTEMAAPAVAEATAQPLKAKDHSGVNTSKQTKDRFILWTPLKMCHRV